MFIGSGQILVSMFFQPAKVGLFEWIHRNWSSSRYNLYSNNMPEWIARESPIDFSFEAYEGARNDAKELFVSELSKLYGVKQECITPTISGSEAIFLAEFKIRQDYESLGLVFPDYAPMIDGAGSLGFKIEKLSPEELETYTGPIAASIPNNPTGHSKKFRDLLSKRLESQPATSFVDETFLEFMGVDSRTAFVGGRSMLVSSTMVKYYGISDTKVGWMFADEEDSAWLGRTMDLVTPVIPPYSLWISYQALKNKGYFDSTVRKIILDNIKVVDSFVEEVKGLEWSRPESAPFGFVHTGKPGSVALCSDILQKTGVFLGPGEYFGDDYGFRISFANSREELEAALQRLREFFNSGSPPFR